MTNKDILKAIQICQKHSFVLFENDGKFCIIAEGRRYTERGSMLYEYFSEQVVFSTKSFKALHEWLLDQDVECGTNNFTIKGYCDKMCYSCPYREGAE